MINKILRNLNAVRKSRNEKRYIDSILKISDFSLVKNKLPTSIKNITFLIPGMLPFSGGRTSILRLGTELSRLGYNVTYVTYVDQSKQEMEKNASINLSNYLGKMEIKNNIFKIDSDIVIATMWDSVFYAKKMSGYKMYFVQDFEPFFYVYGDRYILAKKTYELGLHMISLGKWNKEMIQKNCEIISDIDVIEFPYENTEYLYKERKFNSYKDKKEINISVYTRNTGRRLPFIIQNLLINVKKQFEKDGIRLNINYFGEDKIFKCDGGNNLGKLSKSELIKLYNNSDFGMVASLSNISLVPYEMLATGLPIIEFKEGTFEHFFPKNCAIVTSIDYMELYKNIKECLNIPDKLEEMSYNCQKYLSSLGWDKTGKEVDNIFKKLLR